MNIILPGVGKGLTKSNGNITLNFDNITKAEIKDDGVYIPKDGFGEGIEGINDNWTTRVTGIDSNNTSLIDINRNVVVCIFTMSRFKITNRSPVRNLSSSQETKTVNDILDEINSVLDGYRAIGQAVPLGMNVPQYILTVGDLLQLRENTRPMNPTTTDEKFGEVTSVVTMDDLRRYEDDTARAFFYITEAEYKDPLMPGKYMTKLSIRCAWSELEEFIVGQTYTATK